MACHPGVRARLADWVSHGEDASHVLSFLADGLLSATEARAALGALLRKVGPRQLLAWVRWSRTLSQVEGITAIEQLSRIFEKTWQRPPSPVELERLVDDFILEEAYYREALAMGIDRDDTIIRRRLRQKVEFLTDDLASALPTDDELARDRFAIRRNTAGMLDTARRWLHETAPGTGRRDR